MWKEHTHRGLEVGGGEGPHPSPGVESSEPEGHTAVKISEVRGTETLAVSSLSSLLTKDGIRKEVQVWVGVGKGVLPDRFETLPQGNSR